MRSELEYAYCRAFSGKQNGKTSKKEQHKGITCVCTALQGIVVRSVGFMMPLEEIDTSGLARKT